VALTAAQPTTLRVLVQRIARQLADDRLDVTDMSRAGSLELDPTMQRELGDGGLVAREIRRLEGTIRARAVERHTGPSPIRYFLDGAQKTLPVWRVGTIPIVASVTAAGVLERRSPGEVGLVPSAVVDRVTWVLPRHAGDPTLDRIVGLLESHGERVIDPLALVHRDDPGSYRHQLGFYTHLLERSFDAAKSHREQIELDLLRLWEQRVLPGDPDGWIVADGRLRTEIRNAIGLVKDVQAQHLTGEEAIALYDLPPGHRTSAYALIADGNREQWDRAMWYLRMQNATGQDARHGLIRLETPEVIADPDLADLISSWILAERAPRASADSRWATLLYPIHLLERMLKRRIQAITAGWPA
jgi:hypothetical protein